MTREHRPDRPTAVGRAKLLGVSLSVSLLVGAAACSEGCGHHRPPTDRLVEVEPLTQADLETWVWPASDDRWRALAEPQLVALEQLVVMLVEAAESGRLSAMKRRRAAMLAAYVGVDLHRINLEIEGRPVQLWAVIEPSNDRRGRGVYLIRVGPIGERRRDTELLIQAPHSRFDKYTGTIALRLFLEADTRPPRALFINSAHRYRQLDGSRTRRWPAGANPADAAHNPNHPIARVTAQLLARRKLAVVQLHGFGRKADAGDPEMIVSAGDALPRRASAAMLGRLRVALPERSMGHYGVDTDRLGARDNLQGQAARDARRCFVHIELSEPLREQLRDDREVRRRFAGAVFGGEAEELSGGCP